MNLAETERALRRDHAATAAQRDQLRRNLDEVFAASADVATDDEHDPEGATIAWERSRTRALIEQADAHLAGIDAALDRLHDGTYGKCETCGRVIGQERLHARPAVTTCIDCAR
ncbi:MAG: DnaK suppressor protein [Frankiaceae bacterium]|jgi:RNA polymerase-binding transcription factor DksA|nr:DnaK suppressor protein [Frankiaceae bacterium]